MRIIAGKLKGRQLKSFEASHIRPTTDRVKESIFNILQSHVDGARVLDLFSGTGNLAIESYSRGAAHVEAVEKHPSSLKIISENLKLLGIDKDIKVHKDDVFRFIQNYTGKPFDLIFIDPPFTEVLADKVMAEMQKSQLFHKETIIGIESAKKEKLLEEYGSLRAIDTRHFGDKILTLFKAKEQDAEGSLSRKF
jgi:16S rRNA (guanine966-N2)-methyltransferase